MNCFSCTQSRAHMSWSVSVSNYYFPQQRMLLIPTTFFFLFGKTLDLQEGTLSCKTGNVSKTYSGIS